MADTIYILKRFDALLDDFFDIAAFHTREAAEKKLDELGFSHEGYEVYRFDRTKAYKCSQGNVVCVEDDCPIYKEWLKNILDIYPCSDYEHMADDNDFCSFYSIRELEISG